MLAPRTKRIHLADKIASDGRVSAACFVRPRAINLKVATWTLDPSRVNCQSCLRAIASRSQAVPGSSVNSNSTGG